MLDEIRAEPRVERLHKIPKRSWPVVRVKVAYQQNVCDGWRLFDLTMVVLDSPSDGIGCGNTDPFPTTLVRRDCMPRQQQNNDTTSDFMRSSLAPRSPSVHIATEHGNGAAINRAPRPRRPPGARDSLVGGLAFPATRCSPPTRRLHHASEARPGALATTARRGASAAYRPLGTSPSQHRFSTRSGRFQESGSGTLRRAIYTICPARRGAGNASRSGSAPACLRLAHGRSLDNL